MALVKIIHVRGVQATYTAPLTVPMSDIENIRLRIFAQGNKNVAVMDLNWQTHSAAFSVAEQEGTQGTVSFTIDNPNIPQSLTSYLVDSSIYQRNKQAYLFNYRLEVVTNTPMGTALLQNGRLALMPGAPNNFAQMGGAGGEMPTTITWDMIQNVPHTASGFGLTDVPTTAQMQSMQQALNAQYEALQSLLTSTKTELESRATASEQATTALQSQYEAVAGMVEDIDGDVGQVRTRTGALEARATALEEDYQSLVSQLGNFASAAALQAHIEDKNNPHEVTAEQIGLGSVPNVDATKRQNHTGKQSYDTIEGLGAAALLNVGQSEGTVASGSHTHLQYLTKVAFEALTSSLGDAAFVGIGMVEGKVAPGNHTHNYASPATTLGGYGITDGVLKATYDALVSSLGAAAYVGIGMESGKVAPGNHTHDYLGNSAFTSFVNSLGAAAYVGIGMQAGKVAPGDHTHTGFVTTTVYNALTSSLKAAAYLDVGMEAGKVAPGDHTHSGFVATSTYTALVNTLKAAAYLDVGMAAGKVAPGDHNHNALYPRFYTPLVEVKTLAASAPLPTTLPILAVLNDVFILLKNLFTDHEATKVMVNRHTSIFTKAEVALATLVP